MHTAGLLLALLVLTAVAYRIGAGRARVLATGARLHSRPIYHGLLTAVWCAVPALAVLALWTGFEGRVITGLVTADLPAEVRALPSDRLGLVINDIRNLANSGITSGVADPGVVRAAAHYSELRSLADIAAVVLTLSLAMVGIAWASRRVRASLRARDQVERALRWFMLASSMIAVFTTVGIVLSVLFEALRFFAAVPVDEFLFGLQWSPQTAIRADQVGSSGAFGAVPLFAGTAMVSAVAMLVAAPTGLFAAVWLAEYAAPRVRAIAKPVLEILAGIPTVVYGFFAALVVAPMLRGAGEHLGLAVSSESALAAGLVMGLMLIPFVSSLADDVISAVPQSLRDGAFALGATHAEAIRQVVVPAALPGIVGGLLLAISRAVGETMIVVMAAGMSANLSANPLESMSTVTVQIVALLVGDQEFDSPKTLAAFALGLTLFVVTLVLNVIALNVVRKYREQYD